MGRKERSRKKIGNKIKEKRKKRKKEERINVKRHAWVNKKKVEVKKPVKKGGSKRGRKVR